MIEKQLFAGRLEEVRFTWDRLDEVLDLVKGEKGWRIGHHKDDVFALTRTSGLPTQRLNNPARQVNPCNNRLPETARMGTFNGRPN